MVPFRIWVRFTPISIPFMQPCTLGIMPPLIIPLSISSYISLTEMADMRESGSFGSR